MRLKVKMLMMYSESENFVLLGDAFCDSFTLEVFIQFHVQFCVLIKKNQKQSQKLPHFLTKAVTGSHLNNSCF